MAAHVDLYDGHYGQLATDIQSEIRRDAYGEDWGQASWITAAEAREWFARLALGPEQTALEVACGSGGVTCEMARRTGARCAGVDINVRGVEAARQRAHRQQVGHLVSFNAADASRRLPFDDGAFDALLCNDAINHLPNRPLVFREWRRLVRPGGRVIFSDPVVVTGAISNEDVRARSSIGYFVFAPPGHNERLLAEAGFKVRFARDATDAVVSVADRWRRARTERRDQLIALEGVDGYEGVQRFLQAAYELARDRRLSRYLYLAERI